MNFGKSSSERGEALDGKLSALFFIKHTEPDELVFINSVWRSDFYLVFSKAIEDDLEGRIMASAFMFHFDLGDAFGDDPVNVANTASHAVGKVISGV